jgi:CHAT domain-containing protein
LSAIAEEIKSKADDPADERQRLASRRDSLQKRYNELDAILASNGKLDATRDKQSDLASVRTKLREGEVYFKVAPFKRRAYGIAITRDDVVFYRSDSPVGDLVRRATALRSSIADIDPETNSVPAFKVDVAANLYRVLAGPSDRLLRDAKSIVVDMTGPLASIPFAVLISDQSSVDRYKASRAKSDYSQLEFVVKKSEISNALSPRSFIVSRNQPASSAKFPFLGFGTPAYPDQARLNSMSPYVTRSGCQADGNSVGGSYDQVAPISPDELAIAAQSLGAASAPFVTGSAFTAKAVNSRADISQYAVIHFATHGFREGQWLACSKSPPALLTSMDEGNHDGLLPFDQIASLDLTANLIFLAACNTAAGLRDEELARATGVEETGGSLEGLVRSFLAAKARAVVATHWEVSDDVSLEVVEQFYSRGRHSTIGASLQGAQSALIANKETSHPFFWAPYFIVGDSSKPVLSVAAGAGAGN